MLTDERTIAVGAWFHGRYCDPVMDTPYDNESGYMFVNGGPYDPADVLQDRFDGVIADDEIQEIIAALYDEVGDEWAPIDSEPPDYYDDRFEIELPTRTEPRRKLRERLEQSRQVLTLDGDPAAKSLAEKLVFSAAIGALESFLWETVLYWVENDDCALQDMITKMPVFRDEPIKLGDLFKRQQGLKDHVKGHLQTLVWHRWDKVVPLFRHGLGIKIPSVKPFVGAILKRHDIVHRSGHTKDKVPIEVTVAEIEALCTAIEEFAVEIENLLESRHIVADFQVLQPKDSEE